ncbi:hypothetical protein CEE37_13290 [candidate division LCP-89 bacterium B3_LCP]|uniref:Secretion system C-terminal sorting domain-containing protein n=1 Tax=candidate division LCP-89 bacterium B3_LCP TaxID=2012998 RepID=A0A532USM0_UNCL8|nr:MAG: hypothetical protein CEE37_13290 [candidate division LCP-89 bacterium B3_LCP]
MKRLSTLVLILGLAFALPVIAQPWSLLFWSGPGSFSGYQILGVEFAQDWFFVAATEQGTMTPVIIKFDRDGNLIGIFNQSTTGWGWRDLTYDGSYIYGSGNTTIEAMDLNGNLVPSMNIPGPINPCGALAYDPEFDHFWVTSWSDQLYEIDRNGNVISSGNHGLSGLYGIAWDDGDPDGPWLWMVDQVGGLTFYQFDPRSHVFTGLTYTLPLLPGLTSQTAGGLFFTDEWNPDYYVVGGNVQGTPGDGIYILEMYPNIIQYDIFVDIDYVSGSPVPNSGGNLYFDIFIENQGNIPADFDAWLAVSYEGQDPITLITRSLEDFPPGGIIERQDMWYPVPRTWPSGYYLFYCCVGIEGQVTWSYDFFEFVKSGNTLGNELVLRPTEGVPNPFEVVFIEKVNTIDDYVFSSAFPNPFNPTTTISFQLPVASMVKLDVFDVRGNIIGARHATLLGRYKTDPYAEGFYPPGTHQITFDGSGLVSGIYIYRLSAGDFSASGKMVLMK